jgi:hypothetical protein
MPPPLCAPSWEVFFVLLAGSGFVPPGIALLLFFPLPIDLHASVNPPVTGPVPDLILATLFECRGS